MSSVKIVVFGWVAIGWGVLAAGAQPKPPGGMPVPSVVVTEVITRAVAAGRTFAGTVEPSQRSVVGSAVDGRVLEFPVNEGDWVTKDQPLAQLRTKTIELEVAAGQAALKLWEQELTELKNGSRPEEVRQAKAALARTEALYQYTKSKLDRAESLFAKGGTTSQEELELARSAAVAAYQTWLEAQATSELVIEGPREEKILQAEARVEGQRAEVERLEDMLEKHTIRAPFDGYVIAERAEVGMWVSRAQPVAEVVAVDPVEVLIAVPEQYIAALAVGMEASVHLGALPSQVFPAKITRIVPQADLRARTFPVRLQLPNPRTQRGHLIKGGMLAQVTLAVGQPEPALLVPKDALVLGGPSPVVYVVRADPQTQQPSAVPVPVQVGVAAEDLIQVSGELQAGQRIVVQGNERLRPGSPVNVLPDAAAPAPKSEPQRPQ